MTLRHTVAALAAGFLAATLHGPIPLAGQDASRTVTLDEAIRLSVQRNPTSIQSVEQTLRSRADLLQARGSLLPNVSVGGVYGNSSDQRVDQTTGRLVSESYTAQLQASYLVFGGGRRLTQLRSAGANVDAAEAQERAQGYETVLATTELYYSAAAATAILGAAEQRLARAHQQLEFAETRLELGTATTSDALRAEIEVGNAELAILDAQSALRRTTLELGRQVGEDAAVFPADASLPEMAPVLPSTEALVRQAVGGAPSVLAAQAASRSTSALRLGSFTSYLPSVQISGGLDWFSFNFPPQSRSWSLRLTASLPVFDGFQREATVSRARSQERVAHAVARDAEIGARVAVESAVQDIGAAARGIQISDRSLELAREDLRVQEERYQIGASTILDLQASQIALTDAEVSAVRAQQALGSAVARLEAILGEPVQ